MMHYRRTKKITGTLRMTQDICLCLNGGAEENRNLTRVVERIDCPACIAILDIAHHDHIALEEAASKYIQEQTKRDEEQWQREHVHA